MKIIKTIGYVSGIAASNSGCCFGPIHLQKSKLLDSIGLDLEWLAMLYPREGDGGLKAVPIVAEICTRLAHCTLELKQDKEKFLVMGGDHTSAIGTWSGVSYALRSKGNIGLIWVDAHMDSHTIETTESGNLHGMALAVLLGYGAPELCHILDKEPKLQPHQVCLIGIRSYEKGEAELLKKIGVRIYYMDEVKERGMDEVMKEAIAMVTQDTAGYGISIDLDAMDPEDSPGVCSLAPGGIAAKDYLQSLVQLKNDPRLLGVELVEFNPYLDKEQKTERLICNSIKAIWG